MMSGVVMASNLLRGACRSLHLQCYKLSTDRFQGGQHAFTGAAYAGSMTNISLLSGDLLRIENGRGLLLAVRSGAIWLTQETDPRDFFLAAGRRMRLDKDGLSVAYASVPATLTLAASLAGETSRELPVVTRGRNFRSRGSIHRLARTALAVWLRMHRAGATIGRRLAQARCEEAGVRLLSQLDARTLRDIGLDAASGHPLAARVDAHREQQRRRAFAAQAWA
jgi:hypothetical protein